MSLGLDEINAQLADAAEELRTRWDELLDGNCTDVIGAWLDVRMPRIKALSDQRRSLIQVQPCSNIDELADRLGWCDIEKQHALDCLRDNPSHADAYGPECVITTHSGRELRSPAFPAECDYLRITQHGFELMYWSSDEWRESPAEVIGAVMGAIKNNVEAPQAECLADTFDVSRAHERQGGLL